jgi:heat shock protein HspQ
MGKARFGIGQVVQHRLFDYRGVVVDVDPQFSGGDDWYERVARSRPPKDRPWYHVLVDGRPLQTYVAERNLERDTAGRPIQHPLLERYFAGFAAGRYQSRRSVN